APQQSDRLARQQDLQSDGLVSLADEVRPAIGAGGHAVVDRVLVEVVGIYDDRSARRTATVAAHRHGREPSVHANPSAEDLAGRDARTPAEAAGLPAEGPAWRTVTPGRRAR